MGRTKKIGPAGGLKARYGATVRKRFVDAVKSSRARHRCPQCNMVAVKRESVGIWRCQKCSLVFTGGAYVPSTRLGITAARTARSLESATSKENK